MPQDVLIIGAGVAGLSAAIHARLMGHRVLVVEARAVSGGKAAAVETHGFRFDPGPSIVILPKLYEPLFRAAGKEMAQMLPMRRLETLARVFVEGKEPFDLPASRPGVMRAIERISPPDARAFAQLMDRLSEAVPLIEQTIFKQPYEKATQLLDKKLIGVGMKLGMMGEYKSFIDKQFSSPFMRAFLYGFPAYSGQSYRAKALGALSIPYFMLTDGVYYPTGGVGAIPKALEALARELGARFEFGKKVKHLRGDKGRVREVVFEGGESMKVDAVIVGADRLTAETWLGRRPTQEPSYSYFTVQLGLKTKLPALAHHNLFIPDDAARAFRQLYEEQHYPERPVVYVNSVATTDPSAAPAGGSDLLAVVTSPAIRRDLDWKRKAPEFRERLFGLLGSFGLRVPPEAIAVELVQTPLTFNQEFGNFKGSLYGPTEKERLFGGMFPLGNRDPEYGNLTYCGCSVQPGAGLPMAVLSGRFAVETLSKQLR